ncbi:MAG: glycoside hydrolase family 127 protein [Verrucomicrobia bacterium]|nr:MAG: glycoside hydrolase family 127 protein [Verrucomicrobiota bacterium]
MKFAAALLCLVTPTIFAASDYPVQPVPFTQVRLTGGLLANRQATNAAVTMPFALEQCESSGRIKNFDLAAEVMRRRAAGETNFQIKPPTQYPFDDTDVYKAIEGAAFCLSVKPDSALQAKLETIIKRVAAAQEPDGYLYTFRTMHPDSPGHGWINQQRWLNDPKLSHELYDLGHLYESGYAHFRATGSRSLLDICLKNAALLEKDFGDHQLRIAPGHEIIEMGLAKLYRQTGNTNWLDLAKFFLDNRGHGGEYSQDNKPVVEQDKAVGHAVRANYLYSGMADVAALTGDERYLNAITKIWENVVGTKLHLTGGCGARASGEAYGNDYELPHRCYNETCAAVAFLFWNHRMFLMTGDAKYMDVFERSLYNGVLSGVSLSGDKFFYPNPLEYDGSAKNNHGFAGRAPWFGCACCPPNVLRTLASLGDYVYATQGDKLFVNLYAQGEATANVAGNKVKLEQTTSYPWDGAIKLRVTPEKPGKFTLSLRIPCWVEGHPLPSDLYTYDDATPAKWTLQVNGKNVSFTQSRSSGRESAQTESQDSQSRLTSAATAEISNGFAVITREWKSGDEITLDLPMPVRRVAGNPKVAATKNQVALERGPIVYAFEGVDNNGAVFDAVLPTSATIKAEHRADFLGGVTVLNITDAQRVALNDSSKLASKPTRLTAIPYSVWANRGLSPMAVWLARDAATARPIRPTTLASQAKVTVSFVRDGMSIVPINDQLVPENFTDGFAPNFDFWPHKGTSEWINYEFVKPAKVSSVHVSWFDDTGTGECRVPVSWRVVYRDANNQWQSVANASEYVIKKREPVRVTFDAVTTKALRLEIQLPKDFSAGIYEWEVE